MVEAILSLVALSFIGWIFVLKTKIQTLEKDNRKLRAMLELGVRKMTKDVEVMKGRPSFGTKSKYAHE